MPESRGESGLDKDKEDKEKTPKTKPMPLEDLPDFTEWVKKQRVPTPDDEGEFPPDPPHDLREPRKHGTDELR